MKRTFAEGLVGGVAAVAILATAVPARATLEMQKKAKGAGIAATNCLYCHNEKLPKKGAVTSNERGKWLVGQKDAKKAKEVDVAWLKDYVEKK
jgi:mono/diheme cytochrome c family protein